MFPTKVQVSWPFLSGVEAKNKFSRRRLRRPSWIFNRNEFSYLWSTSHHNDSYQVSIGISVQEEKRKIDFQDCGHGGHFGFLIGTIFAIFDLQVTWCFLPSFKLTGLLVQKKKRKIDFTDCGHGSHLGFLIGTILAIFYLKSPWCFPSGFK